jgi:hypothetical protein
VPGEDGDFQHLVEAGRGFPLEGLFDELKVQLAAGQGFAEAKGAKKFRGREIDVVAVAGVENDFLRVALAVAHAQVVAEWLDHHLSQ